VSEWSRSSGASVPHEEASTREHFKEVGEDIRRARESEKVARAGRKRPWWAFWRRRDEPSRPGETRGEGAVGTDEPPHQPPPGPGSIGTGV
jgi:hypothetical protein